MNDLDHKQVVPCPCNLTELTSIKMAPTEVGCSAFLARSPVANDSFRIVEIDMRHGDLKDRSRVPIRRLSFRKGLNEVSVCLQ